MKRNLRHAPPSRLRFSGALTVLALVAAAFGLYQVKYRVEALKSEIAAVQQKLDEEREGLNVSAAEWAYLTQPQRLQRLSQKYLGLKPINPTQVAGYTNFSRRFAGVPANTGHIINASAQIPPEGE